MTEEDQIDQMVVMTEEDQINQMIDEMFEEYIEGGFDFSSSQTFDEVFKMIFVDAVMMTINNLEAAEEELYDAGDREE